PRVPTRRSSELSLEGGNPYRSGSKATSGRNPPHFETILSGAFGSGSKYNRQSQRSGGTSVMASTPWSVLDQNRATLAAPGKTAAMPMIAMSDGRGGQPA